MCWSSEHGAIGAAPEQLLTETVPFCDGFRRKIGPVVYKKSTKKGGAYFHQRKFGIRSRMIEKIASRAEKEADMRISKVYLPTIWPYFFQNQILRPSTLWRNPMGKTKFNPPAFAPPGVPRPLGRPIGVLHRGAHYVFLHRSCWPWI